MIELVAVFAGSLLVSAAIVPPLRRVAVFRRLLDYPDDARRTHKKAVPRLGGVAVFGGFVATLVAGVFYQWKTGSAEPYALPHTWQLLVACSILFGIGLADDLRGVPPLVKLAGQTAAALIVQYHWPLLQTITFPPHITVSLGWLGVPIMVVWLVGVSNALNLVDGMDGLAGGVSIIALLTFTVAAYPLGGKYTPIASVALAGALLGFLRYNYPPAKMFLGDSGSLVVGFLLAFFAVRRSTRPDGAVLAILPIFALAYPLLDTGIAMLRRWLRGHPLSRADGRHIHHQLQGLGLSDTKAVWIIYAFSTVVAALGLSVTFAPPAFTVAVMAVGGLLLVGVFAYGARWLEYHEFTHAGIILGTAGSLAKRAIRDSIHARDVAKLIEKARSLLEIDSILGAQAETFGFVHMQAGGCDARLRRNTDQPETVWKLEYPIIVPTTDGFRTSDALDESLMLTIWCAKGSGTRSANAERVAQVLAHAITEWTASAPEPVGVEIRDRARTPAGAYTAINPSRSMRTSGGQGLVM